MESQIARSLRKNDEQEGDSNLRPPGFDFRIWAFKNMLSKRQNQEPGVVATLPRSVDGGIVKMTKWSLSVFAVGKEEPSLTDPSGNERFDLLGRAEA